ncbi:RING finger protein 10 [Diaphorina citri]|uniref:E3 ubiquitin-protein ligase RNF10 n=1 Tax=Diaphorina citri TaxID=121845 RepID=A0A3Q0JCT8_DIACI|nr:RING finger protein 10 [Diaphorina citri]
MLDDHTMDKKNRSTQSLNKGNVPESKKSQDAATNKQIPKQSRRREPAGSVPKNETSGRNKPMPQKFKSFDKRPKPRGNAATNKQIPKQSRRREPAGSVPKNETSGRNKPMPQKFKSFDKRPKPRGSFAGGKEGPKINLYEDEPELGSLYSPGSKKQSLNHLLNFQYAPPSSYGAGGGRSSYGNRSQSRGTDYSMGYNNFLMQSLASVHKHKYNKEQFLQANCQFVVRLGEDYGIHLGDPDQLVKWEYIQQIRGFGNEDIKCPICLDLPRAPQMTRCGHCFCWPCILHYLALSDKSWRKCPICYEAVHLGDLKSFRSVIKRARAVNEEVTFQLMKRERGSTVVSPVAQWDFHPTDMLMNVSGMIIFVQLELPGKLIKTVHNDDAVRILESAMNAIDVTQYVGSDKSGEHNTNSTTTGVELDEAEGIEDQTCDLLSTSYDSNTRSRYESVSSEDLGSTGAPAHRTTSIRAEDLDIGPPSHSTSSGVPHRYFYFYQAMDGQQLFLHAVNVRMLEMTYGSLENCPHTITGRILEKETGSMTEELRHRLRYLQHLPVTCQFEVAEIALAPPLISDDTVERFRDQLASRERRRLKRAREDKRRSARIEEAEYVQMHWLRAGSSLNAEDNAVFWPSVGERHRTVSEETDMPLLSSPPNSAYKLSLAQMLGSNTPGIHIEGEQHRGTATGSIQNSGSNTNNNNSKKKKRKQQTLLFATGGNRARE